MIYKGHCNGIIWDYFWNFQIFCNNESIQINNVKENNPWNAIKFFS